MELGLDEEAMGSHSECGPAGGNGGRGGGVWAGSAAITGETPVARVEEFAADAPGSWPDGGLFYGRRRSAVQSRAGWCRRPAESRPWFVYETSRRSPPIAPFDARRE